VVILSRDEAIEVPSTILVAPVTSTIRDLPSQVVIGATEGLDHDSAINLDHVQCVDRASGRSLPCLMAASQLRFIKSSPAANVPTSPGPL